MARPTNAARAAKNAERAVMFAEPGPKPEIAVKLEETPPAAPIAIPEQPPVAAEAHTYRWLIPTQNPEGYVKILDKVATSAQEARQELIDRSAWADAMLASGTDNENVLAQAPLEQLSRLEIAFIRGEEPSVVVGTEVNLDLAEQLDRNKALESRLATYRRVEQYCQDHGVDATDIKGWFHRQALDLKAQMDAKQTQLDSAYEAVTGDLLSLQKAMEDYPL